MNELFEGGGLSRPVSVRRPRKTQAEKRAAQNKAMHKFRANMTDEQRAYYKAYAAARIRTEKGKRLNQANQRRKAKALKTLTLQAYNGPGPIRCHCECGCQENREALLELAHVNGDGAAHRKALLRSNKTGGGNFYTELKKYGFPKDVPMRVECLFCNLASHRVRGKCPGHPKRALPLQPFTFIA